MQHPAERLRFRARSTPWAATLFSSERVFDSTEGVLDFDLYLVALPSACSLASPSGLADRLLGFALDFFRGSDEPVLVYDFPALVATIGEETFMRSRKGRESGPYRI